MLECVVNVSEGRDAGVISHLATACGPDLLDVHSDPFHHRSVYTLVGEKAPRLLASAAIQLIDMRRHLGVHPRIGAVDVVPFVPLGPLGLGDTTMTDALLARGRFARWMVDTHGVPCYLYGPERTLPSVRRSAREHQPADLGPDHPHVTAGSCAVGARPILVAYNVWLADPDLARASEIATALRTDQLRALAFAVGDRVQVSMNLIEPFALGPGAAYDLVASQVSVSGAELVGLIPREILLSEPENRWVELDLDPLSTIEACVERATQ